MEALIALLVLYLFVVLVILPIWTFVNVRRHSEEFEVLQLRLRSLDDEVRNLRAALANLPLIRTKPEAPSTVPAPQPSPPAPMSAVAASATAAEPTIVSPEPPPLIKLAEPESVMSPPLPPETAPSLAAAETPPEISAPPHLPAAAPMPVPVIPRPARPPKPAINWEQFMGAKLFAWLGGLALFLGVAYFVKYSLDHGWIPDSVRVAIGFVFGAGLVVGGLKVSRQRYAITSQTLIAAGIVSLYAVTVACGKDHFNFLPPTAMFLLMSLITATAFILAVRLEAQVVAILGILGGFLTPPLLSTGVDNPGGLFGYLALLDIGLVAVALHRRWFHLVPLGAAGTVIMMIGWAGKFYAPEKTGTAMTVCLVFCALFFGATEAARRQGRHSPLLSYCAIALPAVALGFAWLFLGYSGPARETGMFFGFVFLVSLAVFFLAWREERGGLVTGVAGVTAALLVRWAVNTFEPGQEPVIVTVCLVFCGIYLAVYLLARRLERATPPVMWSAVGMPAVSLVFALSLINHAAVGASPGLLFTFILVSDAVLLALAWLDERLPRLHLVAGLVVFGLLSTWTARNLTDGLLGWALAVYLLFAALHTVFPLLLERHRPAAAPTWWSQLFPPLALLLMLFPIYKLEAVSLLIWPAILLVDLLAIGLAVLSASLASVAAVLVLTLLATGLCIFRVPVAVVFAPSLLLVIGGFAVFFFAASLWLVRKLGDKLPGAGQHSSPIFGDVRAQIPAFSSLLPFLLLIMVCLRLSVPDPSAVFGLGLLLVVLTLGLARIVTRPFDKLRAFDSGTDGPAMSEGQQAGAEWLPACALAGMAALEYAWHTTHFSAAAAGLPLVWYVAFYVVFAAYPFLFRREFARLTGPWTVAALSGVAHFWMVYRTIQAGWPNDVLGLVPALFAVAPLGSLVVILRAVPADNPKRLNQLAWFGGVALFFITLIFPIQFERQWLTVAWALEGAALLWLFHRVPHSGLRAVGAVLLFTAFVRLALNPAVLGYHVRGDTAIFNWYLYAYGLATASLFAGAYLTALPHERVLGINAPPLLNTLGVILAFLLLNIEIADFFTVPGAHSLAFQFSGNFARDMSYTIGWALFALGLLVAGIWKKSRWARYAAIALLSVALIKLFFHDLARLEALYRIGALFAVAVIAIVASLAYQRFLPSNEKTPPLQT
jgi:uncharacterized membrane protein